MSDRIVRSSPHKTRHNLGQYLDGNDDPAKQAKKIIAAAKTLLYIDPDEAEFTGDQYKSPYSPAPHTPRKHQQQSPPSPAMTDSTAATANGATCRCQHNH